MQQTNCHPFRHGNWLFVPQRLRRRLHGICAATSCSRSTPTTSRRSQGSTDTEVVFHLALTFGLEDDPIGALEQTVGQIEETARRQGREPLVQGDVRRLRRRVRSGRCATRPTGTARSLFASCDAASVQRLYPDNARFAHLTDDDRLIVSEPFSDLPGVWKEIPQSSAVRVAAGGVLEHHEFRPLVAVG